MTKKGVVFIDDLQVPFKQDGQEAEKGAFRFRFYIELTPGGSSKKKKKRKQ